MKELTNNLRTLIIKNLIEEDLKKNISTKLLELYSFVPDDIIIEKYKKIHKKQIKERKTITIKFSEEEINEIRNLLPEDQREKFDGEITCDAESPMSFEEFKRMIISLQDPTKKRIICNFSLTHLLSFEKPEKYFRHGWR